MIVGGQASSEWGKRIGRRDHVPVNETAQFVMTLANFTLAGLVTTWCLYQVVHRRDWTPLVVIGLGGAFCSLIEPLWDSVYHLWFYVPGQWNASTVFGVHIPISVFPTYVWFYGGQAYAAYRFVARGATARSVASLAAIVWVVATTFELLGSTNFACRRLPDSIAPSRSSAVDTH